MVRAAIPVGQPLDVNYDGTSSEVGAATPCVAGFDRKPNRTVEHFFEIIDGLSSARVLVRHDAAVGGHWCRRVIDSHRRCGAAHTLQFCDPSRRG